MAKKIGTKRRPYKKHEIYHMVLVSICTMKLWPRIKVAMKIIFKKFKPVEAPNGTR